MPRYDTSLVWFRRDLRDFDHAALHHALAESRQVYCAFVFDRRILDRLPHQDRRVEFIHRSVMQLDAALRRRGGGLIVVHADAQDALPWLAARLGAEAVYANRDYEPQAVTRDAAVARELATQGRCWHSFKDQVIFERDEVLTQSGTPFSVFTPYRNAWLKALQQAGNEDYVRACATDGPGSLVPPPEAFPVPSLEQLGFAPTNLDELQLGSGMTGAAGLLDDFLPRLGRYHETRDFPAVRGPSYLSVHLRFGTVSIRGLVRAALAAIHAGTGSSGAGVWLSELIWRDFYFMILHHHPHVAERSFRPEYDAIRWESGENAEQAFAAWCEGRTGYPLVDAAMAQLNGTGYMHNRLRMVSASFLVKDLGIDWRRGERYFAEKLNDYDLAANNGGWQWASSSGCDAQPYFRIFNPVTQSQKFDPQGKFIRRYLPQLARLSDKEIHAPWHCSAHALAAAGVALGSNYPHPLVQHDLARKRTLERYAVVKSPAPGTD